MKDFNLLRTAEIKQKIADILAFLVLQGVLRKSVIFTPSPKGYVDFLTVFQALFTLHFSSPLVLCLQSLEL